MAAAATASAHPSSSGPTITIMITITTTAIKSQFPKIPKWQLPPQLPSFPRSPGKNDPNCRLVEKERGKRCMAGLAKVEDWGKVAGRS